jgi:hypothetical protein
MSSFFFDHHITGLLLMMIQGHSNSSDREMLLHHFDLPLFSSPDSPPNSTMQKEDFPSHQNVGKCMEY